MKDVVLLIIGFIVGAFVVQLMNENDQQRNIIAFQGLQLDEIQNNERLQLPAPRQEPRERIGFVKDVI